MAGGIGNLLKLQGKVDASGALVITIGSTLVASGAASTGAVGALSTLQGRVTASNELVVRLA